MDTLFLDEPNHDAAGSSSIHKLDTKSKYAATQRDTLHGDTGRGGDLPCTAGGHCRQTHNVGGRLAPYEPV